MVNLYENLVFEFLEAGEYFFYQDIKIKLNKIMLKHLIGEDPDSKATANKFFSKELKSQELDEIGDIEDLEEQAELEGKKSSIDFEHFIKKNELPFNVKEFVEMYKGLDPLKRTSIPVKEVLLKKYKFNVDESCAFARVMQDHFDHKNVLEKNRKAI